MDRVQTLYANYVTNATNKDEIIQLGMASLLIVGIGVISLSVMSGKKQKKKAKLVDTPIPYASGANFLFGHTLDVATKGPHDFTKEKCAEARCNIVECSVMGMPTLVMKGSELLNQLAENDGKLHAKWVGAFVKLFGKDSILNVNGPRHAEQRRCIKNYLDQEKLNAYTPVISDLFAREIATWPEQCEKNGGFIDAYDRIQHVGFHANVKALFGADLSYDDCETIRKSFKVWGKGFEAIPLDLPFTQYGKALKGQRMVQTILLKERKRREALPPGTYSDVLENLRLSVNPETQKVLTDDEFAQAIATIAFGGLDTSVSTETEIVFYFAKNPHVVQKIREEYEAYVKTNKRSLDNSNQLQLSFKEMSNNLPYLRACEKEVQRLTSSGPTSSRRCVESFQVVSEGKKYWINEGDNIWFGLALTCLENPAIQNPEKFDPDRFLPPREEHKKVPLGLPWFGWGCRVCPGQHLALIQIYVLMLSIAISGLKFELRDAQVQKKYKPTLVPVNGLWVKVTKQ